MPSSWSYLSAKYVAPWPTPGSRHPHRFFCHGADPGCGEAYEADHKRRRGAAADRPSRIKYKSLQA